MKSGKALIIVVVLLLMLAMLAVVASAATPAPDTAASPAQHTDEALPGTSSPARDPITAPEPPAHPLAVLWDQPLSTVNQAAYVDQEFPDYPASSSFLSDDFANPNPWMIATVFVPGDGWNGFATLLNATALTWQIYADCAGVPCGDPAGGGAPPVWTLTLLPADPQVLISPGTPGGLPSNTTLSLAAPIILPPGHWWLVFYPTMEFGSYGQYGRQASDTTNGYVGQFINPGGGFGYGTAWQPWMVIGPAQTDIAFRLEGQPALVGWDKTIDGVPWTPGMEITRQTSDTIVVQEVLHLTPPPSGLVPSLPAKPASDAPAFTPVNRGRQPDAERAGQTPAAALAPAAPVESYAPEAVLWDNGPMVTHPGDCAGVDASRLQGALGMNTYGFGHQFSIGNRMADDFTVIAPGGWQIDTITFFAYQTGSPPSPSPITGVYYQIWNGPPDDPGSSIVYGDLATNRLLSSDFTNIQRDWDSGTCPNSRYVFADAAGAGVLLPQGTYWIDWMTDGSLASGPWAPPVTVLGQTTTGNGLQYTTSSGAWGPALDSGTLTQQDLPFVIQGTAVQPIFAQIETWDPARLHLLDWAATGGDVIVQPDRLEWTGEIVAPVTITLTKWFHVEPCTWLETVLWEELWLGGVELEQRPVVIHKLVPQLWIDAAYDPAVRANGLASFVLMYGNNGGFENDVWIRNDFPPEAPFTGSIPPPTNVDPGGLWAEWYVGHLPQGSSGTIEVVVRIPPMVPIGTWIPITDDILDHTGTPVGRVLIELHVIGRWQRVYLPLVEKRFP